MEIKLIPHNPYWESRIYLISHNIIEILKYVGSSIYTKNKRFKEHITHIKYGPKTPLYENMEKCGAENFSIKILEYYKCENENELLRREQQWITHLNTHLNVGIACFTEYYGIDFKYMSAEGNDKITCSCKSEIVRKALCDHVKTNKHIELMDIKNKIFNNPMIIPSNDDKSLCDDCFAIIVDKDKHDKSAVHAEYSKLVSAWKIESKTKIIPKIEFIENSSELQENVGKIYAIVRKSDNAVIYVGRTQIGLNGRYRIHWLDARTVKKGTNKTMLNNEFYNYINELGQDNLYICLLEDTGTNMLGIIKEREQYWTDIISKTHKLFNKCRASTAGSQGAKKYKPVDAKCNDCTFIVRQHRMVTHKKSTIHQHLMDIKKKIDEKTDEKIDSFKQLEKGKIQCSCYIILSDKRTWTNHVTGTTHAKYMNVINKFRGIESKTVGNVIESDCEIICDCGLQTTAHQKNRHKKSQVHIKLMKIKEEIKNGTYKGPADHEILKDGKYLCKCEKIVKCKKAYEIHIGTPNHVAIIKCINNFKVIK